MARMRLNYVNVHFVVLMVLLKGPCPNNPSAKNPKPNKHNYAPKLVKITSQLRLNYVNDHNLHNLGIEN